MRPVILKSGSSDVDFSIAQNLKTDRANSQQGSRAANMVELDRNTGQAKSQHG